MKIFYFKKSLRKIIPVCCLVVMACWGMYGAYLEEPLSLRAGAEMNTPVEEGVSIALKIDDSGKNSGEAVMKLAKDLKQKRLTNVNLFFTKAWVQKYPEAYTFVVKKGIETGVWWYDEETLQEKTIETDVAKVYIMQTAELMSNLAGENISFYLASNKCSPKELSTLAGQIPHMGVSAGQKLEGLKQAEKLQRVEETAELGIVYCDKLTETTIEDLEQIREVLHSKNMEIVKISANQKVNPIGPPQANQANQPNQPNQPNKQGEQNEK